MSPSHIRIVSPGPHDGDHNTLKLKLRGQTSQSIASAIIRSFPDLPGQPVGIYYLPPATDEKKWTNNCLRQPHQNTRLPILLPFSALHNAAGKELLDRVEDTYGGFGEGVFWKVLWKQFVAPPPLPARLVEEEVDNTSGDANLAHSESAHSESADSESAHSESAHSESADSGSEHSESAHSESAHSESVDSEYNNEVNTTDTGVKPIDFGFIHIRSALEKLSLAVSGLDEGSAESGSSSYSSLPQNSAPFSVPISIPLSASSPPTTPLSLETLPQFPDEWQMTERPLTATPGDRSNHITIINPSPSPPPLRRREPSPEGEGSDEGNRPLSALPSDKTPGGGRRMRPSRSEGGGRPASRGNFRQRISPVGMTRNSNTHTGGSGGAVDTIVDDSLIECRSVGSEDTKVIDFDELALEQGRIFT